MADNHTRNIIKKGKYYYQNMITYLERIYPKEHYSFIQSNLMKLVDETDLSLGDRLLINNLSINTFHELLEFASTTEAGKRYDIGTILHLENCEIAKRRLQEHGFKTRDLKLIDVKLQ